MAKVNTVVGSIPAEELGIVAIHAHIGHGMPGRELDMNRSKTLEQRYVEAIPALRQFRSYGGETFVDTTGIHNGRDVDYYKLLSARTGVLIVASTGFNGADTIPPFFAQASVDELSEHFIREITVGIDDTGIRAGLIAVGASRAGGMTELDKRIHRAAARAALATGAPILTQPAIDAKSAIAIFNDEGLPLQRVLFGHTDSETHDSDAHAQISGDTWIAEHGGRIGFNTLGYRHHLEDPPLCARTGNKCLEHLLRFIRVGHLDKALAPTQVNRGLLDGPGAICHTVNHIFIKLIPDLCNAGLDEAAITTMFIDNPADFLAIHS